MNRRLPRSSAAIVYSTRRWRFRRRDNALFDHFGQKIRWNHALAHPLATGQQLIILWVTRNPMAIDPESFRIGLFGDEQICGISL